MNKYYFIIKSYCRHIKSTISFIIFLSISVLLAFSMINIVKTENNENVNRMYDKCGCYTVRIDDKSALKRFEKLKNEKHIKNIFKLNSRKYSYDNKYYYFYEGTENKLSDFGIRLIDGKLPNSNKEIAIERSYLFKRGIIAEKMIGSTVIIPDSDGIEHTYLVSGIIRYDGKVFDDGNSIYAVTNKLDKTKSSLYVQVDEISDYEKIIDDINEKYNLDKDKCYVNASFFTSLGFFEEENDIQKNEKTYNMLLGIVLFCVSLILYNMVIIFLKEISTDLNFYNILGLSEKTTYLTMLIYIIVNTIIGQLIGLFLSLILYIPIYNFMIMKKGKFSNIIELYNVGFVCKIFIAFALIIAIVYSFAYIHYKIKLKKVKKCNARTDLFSKNTTKWISKISLLHLKNNMLNTAFNSILICVAITLFVSGRFFIDINQILDKNNIGYEYKLQTSYEAYEHLEDYEKTLSMIKKKQKELGLKAYYNYESEWVFNVDKEKIDKKYAEYLSEDRDNDISFNSDMRKDINIKMCILGYDDNQIEELLKKNNKKIEPLKNYEAIVVKNTISLSGKTQFKNNFEKYDKLYAQGEEKATELNVSEVVDSLVVYPEYGYNKFCVIVNEETYKKIDQSSFPVSIYLNVDNKGIMEGLFVGNNLFEISMPREEYKSQYQGRKLLERMINCFYVLIILIICFSIYCASYVRIYLSAEEYIMYKSMGVQRKKINLIVIYEFMYMFIIGAVLSIFSSGIYTYYLQKRELGDGSVK